MALRGVPRADGVSPRTSTATPPTSLTASIRDGAATVLVASAPAPASPPGFHRTRSVPEMTAGSAGEASTVGITARLRPKDLFRPLVAPRSGLDLRGFLETTFERALTGHDLYISTSPAPGVWDEWRLFRETEEGVPAGARFEARLTEWALLGPPDPEHEQRRRDFSRFVADHQSQAREPGPMSSFFSEVATQLVAMAKPKRAASAADYASHFSRQRLSHPPILGERVAVAPPNRVTRGRDVVLGRQSTLLEIPLGMRMRLVQQRQQNSQTAGMHVTALETSVAYDSKKSDERPSIRTLTQAESAPIPLNEMASANRLFDAAVEGMNNIEEPLDVLVGARRLFRVLGVRRDIHDPTYFRRIHVWLSLLLVCHWPATMVVAAVLDPKRADVALFIRLVAALVMVCAHLSLVVLFSTELPDEIIRSVSTKFDVIVRIRRAWLLAVAIAALVASGMTIAPAVAVQGLDWGRACGSTEETEEDSIDVPADVCFWGSKVFATAMFAAALPMWMSGLVAVTTHGFFVVLVASCVGWYRHVLRLRVLPDSIVIGDFARTCGLVMAVSAATGPLLGVAVVCSTAALVLHLIGTSDDLGGDLLSSRVSLVEVILVQAILAICLIGLLAAGATLSAATAQCKDEIIHNPMEDRARQTAFLPLVFHSRFHYEVVGVIVDSSKLAGALYILVNSVILAVYSELRTTSGGG